MKKTKLSDPIILTPDLSAKLDHGVALTHIAELCKRFPRSFAAHERKAIWRMQAKGIDPHEDPARLYILWYQHLDIDKYPRKPT